MEIRYIYHGNWTVEQVKIMSTFGINLELGADSFEIDKGDLHDKVFPYMVEWDYVKRRAVGTLYNIKELNGSSILVYRNGGWINGYPQPDDTHEWQDIVYDKSAYCDNCDCGLIQKAPFRLKKAPEWKNRHAFGLEWVYDAIFVKKETYETLYKPVGIDCWPVMLHKKETVIEDTVQLKLPVSNVALDLSRQKFEQCKKCGTKKYVNQIEGFFHSFKGSVNPQFQIFKSLEDYGSGHAANKWIFVTQEMRQQIIKHGIKAQYMPVK